MLIFIRWDLRGHVSETRWSLWRLVLRMRPRGFFRKGGYWIVLELSLGNMGSTRGAGSMEGAPAYERTWREEADIDSDLQRGIIRSCIFLRELLAKGHYFGLMQLLYFFRSNCVF